MSSAAEKSRSAWRTLAARWRLLAGVTAVCGLAALGGSFLVTKSYTARTTLIPPQSQQSSLAASLASLGSVGALAGAGVGGLVKTPADQYVALLQSNRVRDAIIERFDLRTVYESKFQFEAREELARNTAISVGKKDGLITVLVEDHDPKRAAEMANRYVDEMAPWTLRKTDPARMGTVLWVLAEVLRRIAILLQPVMPGTMARLLDQLAVPAGARRFADLDPATALVAGAALPAPQGLFPRIVEEAAASDA